MHWFFNLRRVTCYGDILGSFTVRIFVVDRTGVERIGNFRWCFQDETSEVEFQQVVIKSHLRWRFLL